MRPCPREASTETGLQADDAAARNSSHWHTTHTQYFRKGESLYVHYQFSKSHQALRASPRDR